MVYLNRRVQQVINANLKAPTLRETRLFCARLQSVTAIFFRNEQDRGRQNDFLFRINKACA